MSEWRFLKCDFERGAKTFEANDVVEEVLTV